MDILIVDDEPLAVERLQRMLDEIGGHHIVGTAGNGRDAVRLAATAHPHVVLLDVQMPEMDGVEVAHHMRRLDPRPAIIFCTAYDDYALQAFDASAIDYLVKPVRQERLERALRRAERFADSPAQQAALEPEQRTHLCARLRGNLELIPVEQIICLVAEHKYVTVIHEDGEVLIEEPLVALEEEFGNRFLRVHRNALVALDRIAGLEKSADGGTSIRLTGTEHRLDVSRRNLPSVRKIIRKL